LRVWSIILAKRVAVDALFAPEIAAGDQSAIGEEIEYLFAC
jgi:hypothetical protein